MYQIITNLELLFDNLEEARKYAEDRPLIEPRVPYTAMDNEDKITPRICAAPEIKNCITAIGVLGTFRRCLNANASAKSYENDDEAYPVMILEFDDDLPWKTPRVEQVPDLRSTHERWLLEPARPKSAQIKWLDAYAIKTRNGAHRTLCASVRFLDNLDGYHHPWLDGKGHPLDCSELGGDPWPDKNSLARHIYYDKRMTGNVGFIQPLWPPDGRCLFQPIGENREDTLPYLTYLENLRAFTGYYDKHKHPIFEDAIVEYAQTAGPELTGRVSRAENGAWRFFPWKANIQPFDLTAPIGFCYDNIEIRTAGDPEITFPAELMAP